MTNSYLYRIPYSFIHSISNYVFKSRAFRDVPSDFHNHPTGSFSLYFSLCIIYSIGPLYFNKSMQGHILKNPIIL